MFAACWKAISRCCPTSSSALAQAQITIVNTNAANVGFNDPMGEFMKQHGHQIDIGSVKVIQPQIKLPAT